MDFNAFHTSQTRVFIVFEFSCFVHVTCSIYIYHPSSVFRYTAIEQYACRPPPIPVLPIPQTTSSKTSPFRIQLTLKGLKTPTTAAPVIPETMSACQAAQVPSQPHLPPPQLTSPAQLPLQPPTHPRRPPGPHSLVQKRPPPPSTRRSLLGPPRPFMRHLPRDKALELARPAGGCWGVEGERAWIRARMCRSAELGFVVGG